MQWMSWFRRVAEWIWDARPFWIAIFAPAGAFWVSLAVFPAWEPRLRITGLVLQLFGLTTVIKGLLDTQRLFRRPSLLEDAAAWFHRFPRYRVNVVVGLGSGSVTVRSTGSARLMISLPPTASLADRIVALEETQRQQSDLIADVRDRIDKEVRVRASELESERRDREGEDNKIQGRLEEASAGGLHVERVGVFWLFLGLVFGTASTEIAKFFGG